MVQSLSLIPIAYIDISLFAHATEDEDKVLEAAEHLLPLAQTENVVLSKRNVRGHHGNPITVLESRIKEKEIVRAIVENLSSNLSPLDRETLSMKINLHVDKGNLYLRFDKQAAFQRKFKLGVADPIRLCLHFKKSKIEDIVKICRENGILT
jgi:hypothetical protein